MSATASATRSGARPSSLLRLYGYGSVFGKTLRDSRRATLLVGGFMALLLIGVSKAIVTEFATPASRQELVNVVDAVPPILAGLAGKPVNVGTLGGYLQYKYGTFFPIVVSLWSILALSGTLAAEARRGSLEFVAAAPISRVRIALSKLFGHLTSLAIVLVVVFLSTAYAGSAFAVLPGDAIGAEAAFSYALWLGLMALAAGGLAFAIAPFVGRNPAAGIAGAVMFGGFILNGYQGAIPALAPFANLTWFGWTTNHIPLAGAFDWASLIPVAVAAAAFLAIGVVAFVRRDIGATSSVPVLSLPGSLAGLRGPVGRMVANALPTALAWGIGIGVFGLVIAGSGSQFLEQLAKSPDFLRLLQSVFPNADIASPGGFLELLFIDFGLVLAGLAAATLVGVWASDETSGRLEMVLSAPLGRARWVVAGGAGLLISIAVVTVLAAAGIAIGSAITGGDVATPVIGTLTLGVYALAIAGIGVAVGGVVGTGAAAVVAAIVVILFWGGTILAPAFSLPEMVRDLALTAHYGLPMVGRWDAGGVLASLVLAVGGVALGAWGFARRDTRG
jgi:ABC-2 type transport system permease protein